MHHRTHRWLSKRRSAAACHRYTLPLETLACFNDVAHRACAVCALPWMYELPAMLNSGRRFGLQAHACPAAAGPGRHRPCPVALPRHHMLHHSFLMFLTSDILKLVLQTGLWGGELAWRWAGGTGGVAGSEVDHWGSAGTQRGMGGQVWRVASIYLSTRTASSRCRPGRVDNTCRDRSLGRSCS